MKSADELRRDINFSASAAGYTLSLYSTWGIFSPKQIDEGTSLLLERIIPTIRPDARCIDLGCGYGAIGLFAAAAAPQGEIHLIDKDFVALKYARRNARHNRLDNCRIYPGNGLERVRAAAGSFDAIYSNLPAKVGREQLFIFQSDALQLLKPGGELTVVTILGLKEYIKRNFKENFGNYKKLKQGRRYVVARAIKS